MLTLLACYGAGRALWFWKPPTEVLAVAAGAAALSLALFLLLAAGIAHPLAIAALTLGCALASLIRIPALRRRPVGLSPQPAPRTATKNCRRPTTVGRP